MAAPGIAKKVRLLAYVRSHGWSAVGPSEWHLIRSGLPDITENSIRNCLREAGIPVAQPFAGIDTKSLEQLEQSLLSMADAYKESPEKAKTCRAQVIAAKDRARFASNNPKADPAKRVLKREMVEWMLVWLGDPAMFTTWAAMRKRTRPVNPLT